MAEGLIATKNTARKYLKGAADQTIRSRIWLAYLKKLGRIKYNSSGVDCYWNVMARQPEVRQNGDAGQQTFSEHDAYEQLNLDVRGYVATDRFTLKKKLMNSDPVQIVDVYGTKLENLTRACSDNFNAELYIDGNASGNDNRIHGLESFMGDDGATVAGDLVANPSDTYAGKSTALANLGGSWSTSSGITAPNATIGNDWPLGNGDSEYDYLAPKLLNYSSTAWPSGTATWANNCTAVMRRARTWCESLSGAGMAPTCFMLSRELYDEFEDYQEAKFRTIIPHKEADDFGFSDVLRFNGAMIKSEFDVTGGVGYGLNMNEMSLFTIHDNLFYSHGPEWDLQSLSYLFLVGFFGNVRCNPKHFSKLAAYA